MAKSNYPHKQRNGGSNRGALIALLVLLIIAAAVFLLRSCTDGKTPDPAPGGIVYDPGAVEGGWNEADTDGAYKVGSYDSFSGSKTIALKINGCVTTGTGRGQLTSSAFPVIAAGGSQKLTYFAKVSGDAPNSKDVQAANVVFTISIVD